jgi:DNA repair exonuclease SbcCD ATPase subunit
MNEELQVVLEQLQLNEEQLHQKNQELAIAYQLIDQKQQQLQTTRDELELLLARQSEELVKAKSQLQRLGSNIAAMLYEYVLHSDGSESFTYVSPKCRDIYELESEELQEDFGRV